MIPRSRLTLSDEQRQWLREIANRDQADAVVREFARRFTGGAVHCPKCDAVHHRFHIPPDKCVNCGHPLGKDGAA
jgi:uncharacterized protein (DUF983 family)